MTEGQFRGNLRKAYDRYASERDDGTINSWKTEERTSFLELIQSEGKRRLLEIGSGPGRDGKFFQDAGLQVVCIDLSQNMVELCREKGLTAYVMDMTQLDFAAGSFDSVYALNSFLHLAKQELPDVLRRVQSVLAPNGLFYMGVYGGIDSEGVRQDDHYEPKRFFSFFTDEALNSVVSKVFEIHSFKIIALPADHHFQSLVLRKPRRPIL